MKSILVPHLLITYCLLNLGTLAKAGEFYEAARAGDLLKVKSLLAANPKVLEESEPKSMTSPLQIAVIGGHKEVVEFLVSKKANVNAENKFGQTPLHSAARRGNKVIVELLLKNGAKVDTAERTGITPLYATVLQNPPGAKEVIEILLAHKANPNVKVKQGSSALEMAQAKKMPEIVALLKKYGGK